MITDETQTENLVRARYGVGIPETSPVSDALFQQILAHKSVRHYRQEPLPEGTLERLIAAGQSAATSSNLQTWSVVALQNPEHKAQASVLCGDQNFIRQAPLFLVFCADLARLAFVSEQEALPGVALDYTEMFLMATIDASLAAQNVAVAAEAMGLGICYVGAARNCPRELAELLHLPRRVFALFGMAVGWPAETDTSAIKPRLPQSAVVHREVYTTEEQADQIAQYNATMQDFYASQKMNIQGNWATHSAKRIATVEAMNGRHILHEALRERGFELY